MPSDPSLGYGEHRRILRRILRAYDSRIVRSYIQVRFLIINLNMIHLLRLCLRGKKRILEVGCGFGLFGCYFALRNPRLHYHGIDVNPRRIDLARRAAARLGLQNVRFDCADARGELEMEAEYDAVLMMDLLHHIPDEEKLRLLSRVEKRLSRDGILVIKDVTRRPAWKLFFTWALDVLMTRGFDMWYWDPGRLRSAVDAAFTMEVYPVSDVLPYPHVIYLFQRDAAATAPATAPTIVRSIPPAIDVRARE